MALTSNSHIFARFHESAFNNIIHEIMVQRPKLFNYATARVAQYNGFCSPIEVNPVLEAMGVEKFTVVDKLPIAGLNDSTQGLDYCVQICELKLDFQPGNQIMLPPELGNLALQEFALKGKFCAGINCGGATKKIKVSQKLEDLKAKKTSGIQIFPYETLDMMCFCLELFAKVIIVRESNYLKLKLTGIEVKDILPVGLENSIECYLKSVLDLVVFPKMKIALEDLVFNAGSYFSIGLTPISSGVPYNPNISDDYIKIFLNII